MVAPHCRGWDLTFQVSIPMNVPPIFGGFSCVAEPTALSSGDRAARSCLFVSCHPTDGFQATEKSSPLFTRKGRTGQKGFLCAVLLPSVQQKDGDADRTGCFLYTMYTKHRSLLFVRHSKPEIKLYLKLHLVPWGTQLCPCRLVGGCRAFFVLVRSQPLGNLIS